MKILQVFDLFSLVHGGGTVDIVYKLSRALSQKGHEVTIYTSDFELDHNYVDSLAKVNVRLFHCQSYFAGFYIMLGMIGEARKELKGFDIIHLHCLRSFQNIVMHYYARKYGIPYVVDTHGSLPRKAAGETGLKWLLRWLFDGLFGSQILNDAARIITENEFGLGEYEAFGAKNRRIAVIPLFFPVEDFIHQPHYS
ncbi:glycosyltransferase [Chloroflexota bacterium]